MSYEKNSGIYVIPYFLCMLIPIIFTNRRIEKVNGKLVENEEVKQEQPKEEYSYKQYGTIKLLHEKQTQWKK